MTQDDGFEAQVVDRFGILPNFFRSAEAAPGLVEGLWTFAKSSYLDSPLPSIFKERLFVHLSRFCEARYCIVRHVGFLLGEGRPAGDARASPASMEQALTLLRRPVPDAAALDKALSRLEGHAQAVEPPLPETQEEIDLFDALTVIFVTPRRSGPARSAVRHYLGTHRFELLVALLAFIRTAHYWTETHPELQYEPDMVALMAANPELAALLTDASEAEAMSGGAQRLRAEAALRESETRYRALFEAIDEAVMVIQRLPVRPDGLRDYRYVALNPKAQQMFGIGDLTGQSVRDNFPDEDEGWYDLYDQAVETGEVARFEREAKSQGMFLQMFIARVDAPSLKRAMVVIQDVTARKVAETSLQDGEERRAFLLELSDVLRSLADPVEIKRAAMKLLAEQHDVMRAAYLDVDADGDLMTMSARFERDAVPSPEHLRLSDYGPGIADAFRAGQTLHVCDTDAETQTDAQRAAYRAIGVRAWIVAPLVRKGQLLAVVGVQSRTARNWTRVQIQLVTDLAERTWEAVERARAEGALRSSEARFREFGEASQDVLWIRDADNLQWVYLSDAFETIYGAKRKDALSGSTLRNWLNLILPDDREPALNCLRKVREGGRATFEYRIRRPSDGMVRWLRNTDFPIRDEAGKVVRIGGIGSDITAIKDAEAHQQALLAELQHRVRNSLAVVRSITRRTAQNSESVEDMAAHLEGRIGAFARVQAMVTRNPEGTIDLAALIEDELLAYATRESEQVRVSGPDIGLMTKPAEILSLAFHELITNSIKHGALLKNDGRLRIAWAIEDSTLHLIWTESGASVPATAPERDGFGTELLLRLIPYELKAETRLEFRRSGAEFNLSMPLAGNATLTSTH